MLSGPGEYPLINRLLNADPGARAELKRALENAALYGWQTEHVTDLDTVAADVLAAIEGKPGSGKSKVFA